MTEEEQIEVTSIHSIAGLLTMPGLMTDRPFRSPHTTVRPEAIVGGGRPLKPGEATLAHRGVLFLDEFPELDRDVLESLRGPLEDREVQLARAGRRIRFPASFSLVAAMNPCPCGHAGSGRCSCAAERVKRYVSRISGPLLDRIDIHVEVPAVRYNELAAKRTGEASSTIRTRVVESRERQKQRFHGRNGLFCNADMQSREIKEFCQIDEAGASLLKTAMTKLGLSARAYDRILKVSRTIADLAGSESIKPEHLGEAIQYRSLDRGMYNT
jgi:magnesium chelatase family protein